MSCLYIRDEWMLKKPNFQPKVYLNVKLLKTYYYLPY